MRPTQRPRTAARRVGGVGPGGYRGAALVLDDCSGLWLYPPALHVRGHRPLAGIITGMVDAALYQRVSDGTDRSVDQQNAANVAVAVAMGWSYRSYSDPVSASRFSRSPRPDWVRLVKDVRAGRYRYVVLWESSRGDRKLATWAAFLDACREAGVGIYVTSHTRLYDVSVARDWRSLAEDGVDSAYESEKTSLRSIRGAAGAAKAGEPYGRVPYGYRRTYEVVVGRPRPKPIQVPDESEAPVVREIVERIANGDPVSRLLRDFAARGIVTRAGRAWSRASVTRLVLEGVVYIGKRRHNGGPLLPGNWNAIVSESVYWSAVAVLRDPARKVAATRGGAGIRPGAAKWLLSYVGRCAVCDGPLSVRLRYAEPYYRCNASGGHAYCPVEWMDGVVTSALLSFLAQPGVFAAIMFRDEQGDSARAEASAERDRLADLERLMIAGDVSSAVFARVASGIEARIADLESQASSSYGFGSVSAMRELLAGNREESISQVWDGLPLAARREVMRRVCDVKLAPVGTGGLRDPERIVVGLPKLSARSH